MTEEVPNRIRAMADDALAKRTELDAELLTAATRKEKKNLRARIKLLRDLERFCRTRAGYR